MKEPQANPLALQVTTTLKSTENKQVQFSPQAYVNKMVSLIHQIIKLVYVSSQETRPTQQS